VTVRLAPVIPSQVAIAQFPSAKAATEAVIEILNTGVNLRVYNHGPCYWTSSVLFRMHRAFGLSFYERDKCLWGNGKQV